MTAANIISHFGVDNLTGNTKVPLDNNFKGIRDTELTKELANSSVILTDDSSPKYRYVLGPSELSETAVSRVDVERVSFKPWSNKVHWEVDFELTDTGLAKWNSFARRHFREYIAVVFQGKIIAAPWIEGSQSVFMPWGHVVPVGLGFTESQAKEIAKVLDATQ